MNVYIGSHYFYFFLDNANEVSPLTKLITDKVIRRMYCNVKVLCYKCRKVIHKYYRWSSGSQSWHSRVRTFGPPKGYQRIKHITFLTNANFLCISLNIQL